MPKGEEGGLRPWEGQQPCRGLGGRLLRAGHLRGCREGLQLKTPG